MNDEWEKFLDDAVSHIRDKKIKGETREELLDHLEDRKERFMRFGDNEEEAERKSLENMGDREELSRQLGKLHSFAYVDELSRAMLIMVFGFLFSLFNINIGDAEILNPIGTVLIFVGSYQLRNCNPLLKKAWYMSIIKVVWSAFTYSIKAVPFFAHPQSEWVSYSVLIPGIIISTVYYALLLLGIGELSENAAEDTNFSAPKMKISVTAYVIATASVLLGALTENPAFVKPNLIISFLCFAYIVLSVLHAYIIIKKTEYRTDRIDKFGKNGVKIISGALAFVILSVGITCYVSSTPKVKSEVYTPVHTEETDKIRAELIEHGFPKDIAKMLPDEEIKKCYPLDETLNILDSNNKQMRDKQEMRIIAVPRISPISGEQQTRYIFTFEYKNGKHISGYRDSVQARIMFPTHNKTESYGIFYKKDGKIYKQEPLRTHQNVYNVTDGLEYRTVKGANKIFGYMAVTGYSLEMDPWASNQQNPLLFCVSEKYPFNYIDFNAFDVMNEAGQRIQSPPFIIREVAEVSQSYILTLNLCDRAISPSEQNNMKGYGD